MNYADQVGKKIDFEVAGTKYLGTIVGFKAGPPDKWEIHFMVGRMRCTATVNCSHFDRGIQ